VKRTSLNPLIDIAAFVALAFLISTGLLMRYQLPPGSGGLHSSAIGHGAEAKTVSILWGLSRHEWGDIHYWVSITIMGLLAVHLLLHWKWIAHVLGRRQNHEASGSRFAMGLFGLVAVLFLACAPLLGTIARAARRRQCNSRSERCRCRTGLHDFGECVRHQWGTAGTHPRATQLTCGHGP
jgi:hypothetical protein